MKLLLSILLPVLLVVIIYLCQRKGLLKSINIAVKQIIIGLIFGLLTCLLNSFGYDVNGELIRLCDASILCCGLIFGSLAGIIAGTFGAIYSFIFIFSPSSLEIVKNATAISCILAGLYAAFARRYMFEKKMPSWIMGFFIGITMEVIHFNFYFSANVNDFKALLNVLNSVTIPTIFFNGITVSIAILIITIIARGQIFLSRKNKVRISQTVQAWLLGTVLVALIFSALFTFSLQAMIANMDTEAIIEDTISDVKKDIKDASDENLLKLTQKIENQIRTYDIDTAEELIALAERNNVDEINVVNHDGIITVSTFPNYTNFDMKQGEQSAEFMCLVDGDVRSYVQSLMPVSYDSSTNMKYAGVRSKDAGFIQVGYSEDRFYDDIRERISLAAVNRHIGNNGYVVITDSNYEYESYGAESDVLYLSNDSGPTIFGRLFENVDEYTLVKGNILNRDIFCMYTYSEGYYIIGVYPLDEAYFTRNIALYSNCFTEIIIFTVLFTVIYILIRVIVVNNIFKINKSLAEITGGNLDTVVDVRNNEEFSLLSNDINTTVSTLKRYIEEAASRIDAELQYARDIQSSALPHIAPNFIDKEAFELNACMFTAKEVGGDFYDFYYIDDKSLAITIADVSGKGIPAALFMMTSKTMLRNMIESGIPIEEAMTLANDRLCENNDANMFVTVWSTVIDLETGHMEFSNAGHNHPLVRKKNGSYEFLKSKPGMVLAGMEGVKYRPNEYQLDEGDILYFYTDGVTEATNVNNELFGDLRLVDALNKSYKEDITMEEVCMSVKAKVDEFVDQAPQFDDITMVAFKYKNA